MISVVHKLESELSYLGLNIFGGSVTCCKNSGRNAYLSVLKSVEYVDPTLLEGNLKDLENQIIWLSRAYDVYKHWSGRKEINHLSTVYFSENKEFYYYNCCGQRIKLEYQNDTLVFDCPTTYHGYKITDSRWKLHFDRLIRDVRKRIENGIKNSKQPKWAKRMLIEDDLHKIYR